MNLFSDSGVGLILSMVHSRNKFIIARLMMRVLYNERTNCLRARVEACSFTNRLHGKAAERAVR